MRPAISAALLLVWLAPARAQDDELARAHPFQYSPPSRDFTCNLPPGWQAFEEQDEFGDVVHALGPEDGSKRFRAGIEVRWNEKGAPGFQPYKQFLAESRRSGGPTNRGAGVIHVIRTGGVLARVFDVTETRALPADRWPARPLELHRYVAVFPSGESYFTITLDSDRDDYLEYRQIFLDFLKDFRPTGGN